MRHLYTALLLLLASISSTGQIVLSPGSAFPAGVVTGNSAISPEINFSPAPGTYGSPQTVTITSNPSGISIFYTTDGSAPNAASKLYSGPITVSTSQTIKAIAVATGSVNQDTNLSSSGWKCNTVDGGTSNGVTCNAVGDSGGIGTIQPSAWNMTFGSTASYLTSTTASTSETQQLFVFTGTGCDDCTAIAEDEWIEPLNSSTSNANVELDMWQYDETRNILHMGGLQCNQQPGNPGYGYWQIDNEQGSWQNTTIRAGCPLSTSAYTHVGYTAHWIIGDTACGGYGCMYYDTLTINGTTYSIGMTLENYTEPGWSSACGHQHQNDLTNTSTSGDNPTNGGRYVQSSSVTCSYSTSATGSASYTIE